MRNRKGEKTARSSPPVEEEPTFVDKYRAWIVFIIVLPISFVVRSLPILHSVHQLCECLLYSRVFLFHSSIHDLYRIQFRHANMNLNFSVSSILQAHHPYAAQCTPFPILTLQCLLTSVRVLSFSLFATRHIRVFFFFSSRFGRLGNSSDGGLSPPLQRLLPHMMLGCRSSLKRWSSGTRSKMLH